MPGKKRNAPGLPPDIRAATTDSLAILTALSGAMAVLILSPSGMILSANDNFMTLMRITVAFPKQSNYQSLLPPGNNTIYDALLVRIASGQFHAQCIEYQTADDAALWLDAAFVPVFNGNHALEKIIVLQSDATERVAREERDRQHLNLLWLGINETDNAVCVMNSNYHIIFQNAGFARMLGYTPEETLGKRPREIFYSQPSIMQLIDEFVAALKQGQSYHAEARIHDKQNRLLWISMTVNPIINEQHVLTNAVCILTDITTLKMQEILQSKAFDAMARDASLADTMALICQEVDEITPDTLSSVHQLDSEQQLLSLAGPSLPATYHDIAKELMSNKRQGESHTFFIEKKVPFTELECDPLWEDYKHRFVPTGLCAVWMSLVHDAEGKTIGLLVFYCFEEQRPNALHQQLIDLVTPIFVLALARETTRSRIEKLAYYDALTGLANRSMIKLQASEAIVHATNTDTCLAVLFIDLDRFKQVNDSLGHHAGDELLRTVAARLVSVARKSDIVGRLSGDEFLVVLTNCNPDNIAEIAKRFQQALAMPCHINGIAINPSASIGISIFPDNGNTIDTLLHRADLAMYMAKEKMRGSFGFFSEDTNAQAQDQLTMEAALRSAIQNNTLTLHYQPQVHLKKHRLYGVEALARWEHEEWGMIAPERFIAVAEACGLIGELSTWVLEEACRQLADWRARDIPVPCIAVNLSASNFHDKTLANTIAHLLEHYQLPANSITLEITETVIMDTNPDTTQNIHDIHALGLRIAIDDFGTGYSSLSYLRNLPVAELKLDKTFVRDIDSDPTVLALATAIIHIGESLGLTIVAEGVEDQAQLTLLKDNQCDVAQGYLISRPITADAIEQWLKTFQSDGHGHTPEP